MFKISKSVDSTNNNPSVLFNYYPTIIENIQVSSDEKNDTVISAPFTGKANEPNINYMDDKRSRCFTSPNVYTYGKNT
jgi:hypothetical protein